MKKRILAILCTAALLASAPLTAFAGTWQTSEQGWWYQNDDGSYPSNNWHEISGEWFHFDENGYMQTGWFQDADTGNWYYLNPDGVMRTADLTENGAIYHFNADGSCVNPDAAAPAQGPAAGPSDDAGQEDAESLYELNYLIFSVNLLTLDESLESWSKMLDSGDYDGLKTSIQSCRLMFEEFANLTPPPKYAQAHAELKQACDATMEILDVLYELVDSIQTGTLTEEKYNQLDSRMTKALSGLDSHINSGIQMMEGLMGLV